MHSHASPKSTELLNKSLSVLNTQEVTNMNWYESLWFRHFMNTAKDYSYFFLRERKGQEQNCRTII